MEERRDDGLVTVVVNGGPLGQHKGINAPGVALPASALTEKDAPTCGSGSRSASISSR